MAESIESSLGKANGVPEMAEQTTQPSRPASSLSGCSDIDGTERPVREKLKKASIAGLSTHAKNKDEMVRSDAGSVESTAGEDDRHPEDTMLTDTSSPLRGRPTRKRSFDDLQNESMTSIDPPIHDDATRTGGHHKRMRSKDMSSTKRTTANGRTEKGSAEALAEEEDDAEAQKSPGGAGIMVEAPSMDDGAVAAGNQSPKKKRSRDQFDKDHNADGDALDKEEQHAVISEKQPLGTEDEVTQTISNGDKGEPDKKRHRDASQEGREAVGTERVTTKV